MPAGDFVKFIFGGSVGGSEHWSVGLWFSITIDHIPTPTEMNTGAAGSLNDLNTKLWQTTGGGLKSANSSGTTLASSTLYFYRNGVLQARGAATITPDAGSGSAPQPVYVARCVTLLSASPGRSKRGRAYLPWTGQAPSATTGLWGSGSGPLTGLKDAIDAIALAAAHLTGTSQMNCVVMSGTHGLATDVVSLRMDNKPDTQRGRERSIAATLQETAAL